MTTKKKMPAPQHAQHQGGDEITHLIELNQRHSQRFNSPGEKAARQLYRARHSTEIGVSKCMDGRLHLPVITETAMGIIQPWRNIGGKFDLSWPLYQESILDWRDYAIAPPRGRKCLKLVTYHFSRGDVHRGCRGFNYDRDAAQAYTAKLKLQFDEDFGQTVFKAVHVGIETDWEALILHGDNDKVVDLADVTDASSSNIREMLRGLYPDMDAEILRDFIPLIQGNIRHIAMIREQERNHQRDLAVDAEHREWVLGYGRGFDWLHEINLALIVGPFDPDRRSVVKAAAGLIQQNYEAGRTGGHSIVLLSSAFYRDPGAEAQLKRRKALGLEQEALQVIKEFVPDLWPHLRILTGVVDSNTRKMEVLRKGEPKIIEV